MSDAEFEAITRLWSRMEPKYRFVDQTGRPVPPLGFHFPWKDHPNTCAMCEKGYEELKRDTHGCEFEWPPRP